MLNNDVKVLGNDGGLMEVGPSDPQSDYSLKVPRYFRRELGTELPGVKLVVQLKFSNGRLTVTELCVGTDTGDVTSRFLQEISMPEVLEVASSSAIPNFRFWKTEIDNLFLEASQWKDNPLLISKIYWFEHIIGGKPRKRVQQLLGYNRNQTNYFIKNLANLPRKITAGTGS